MCLRTSRKMHQISIINIYQNINFQLNLSDDLLSFKWKQDMLIKKCITNSSFKKRKCGNYNKCMYKQQLYKTLGSGDFPCNIASVFITPRKLQIQVQLHPPLSWCSSVCNLVRILIQKIFVQWKCQCSIYCRGFETMKTKKAEKLKKIERKKKRYIKTFG